ncbi:MAG: GH3 auxin-responsive promoter family protein [Deltaproteobacteria bacterium]|nr:GH3 auxin-responsive promoter family protein [Deltaproteobacteria bacterium]
MSLASGLLWLLGHLPDDALRAGSRVLFGGSWRRFEAAVRDPRAVQEERLKTIVARAKDTAFGKTYGFADVRSLADYQAKVPIMGYEGFEPFLLRMVEGEKNVLIPDEPYFFGRSSGTTGTPKYIPVTEVYTAEYRLPRRVWARQVMQAFPGLVRGKILTVHSPKVEGETPAGVPYGSVTVGLSVKRGAPERALVTGPLDAVPKEVFLLEDFELKYYALLRLAAQERVSLAAAINPSTLVLLAEKLNANAEQLAEDLEAGTMRGLEQVPEPQRRILQARLRKDRAAAGRLRRSRANHGRVLATDLWPDIAGLCCWKGGSAPFYLAQLPRWFPDREVMDYGFLATEGGFTIPLSTEGASGVVSVLGHVLEFVPEDEMAAGDVGRPLLADELEVGARYRVLVTGSHGLYRYDINDVVECTGYYDKTACIAFVHKGGNMLSITGEKVGESHVVEAMGRAEAETGLALAGFSVSCQLSQPPRYLVGVEPVEDLGEADARRLLAAFEGALGAVNIEYEAKRSSQRLGPAQLVILAPGAFARERARRVEAGAPDSHVKPPHLLKVPEHLLALGVARMVEPAS